MVWAYILPTSMVCAIIVFIVSHNQLPPQAGLLDEERGGREIYYKYYERLRKKRDWAC